MFEVTPLGWRVPWHLEVKKECSRSLLCLLLLRCCHPCQIPPASAPLLQVHFFWVVHPISIQFVCFPQLQQWPEKSSAGDSWLQLWCLVDGKEVNMPPPHCHSIDIVTKVSRSCGHQTYDAIPCPFHPEGKFIQKICQQCRQLVWHLYHNLICKHRQLSDNAWI